MLATVAAVVVTGLFSGGEDNPGPFAGLWCLELSDAHEILFRVLQGLVVVHVLGVLVETLKVKDALVPAMITGVKRRRSDEPGADASRAALPSLLIALFLSATVAALLISQPPARTKKGEAEQGHSETNEDQRSEDSE
ncbi:MAG: hypothetical protein FD160_347 [Caulobacteraceae bacterium]|nr:MAG: hypothetical protein FD160_347 [Caulobacteraceae bacterium]